MSDVTVNTVTLELRTAKLNKSILRQLRRLTYNDITALGGWNALKVIGWVDGSVLDNDLQGSPILVIDLGNGDYASFHGHYDHKKKWLQIFIV